MLLDRGKLLFDYGAFQGEAYPVMTFMVLDGQLLGSEGSSKLGYQIGDNLFLVMVISGAEAKLGDHTLVPFH